MAKYVLLFIGGQEPQGEAEQAAVMQAWTDWFTALGQAVKDPGNPFSPMSKNIASNGAVSDGPVGALATGYSIIEADSLEDATRLAKDCPHLQSGGQLTVYETFEVM